ncbi:MAG: methyltransferase [Ferruginibacter sp.]
MKKQPDLLDENYWSNRYRNDEMSWDLGRVSPPLKAYFDQLTNKQLSVLIPGCGNAHEVAYLLEKGFTNITLIDISPIPVEKLKLQFAPYLKKELHIICGDFFNLNQTFDLILEQTFFCALRPSLRQEYVLKMTELLSSNGKLVGLLFNRAFDGGPPFGGSKKEYQQLFLDRFHIQTMAESYNSAGPRQGSELFVIFKKAE